MQRSIMRIGRASGGLNRIGNAGHGVRKRRGALDSCRSSHYVPPPLVRGIRLANHKSAKKRARQDLKRRARNRRVRGGLKTAIKAARTAIAGDDSDAAAKAARNAEGVIRRAASKGVLTKKQASRRVSRLARAANSSS
jgi:small subunit ribosomal protein S20